MPPWENTIPVELICATCENKFFAKRKSAKYCSDRCREVSRPPRPAMSPEVRARANAKRKELYEDPEYRKLENQKAYARWRAVKDWVNDYKVSQGCIDCGYDKNPVALDIDHVNGKTYTIANLRSISAVQAEITRHDCVVRCANCHRIKSFETKSWLGHSTSS